MWCLKWSVEIFLCLISTKMGGFCVKISQLLLLILLPCTLLEVARPLSPDGKLFILCCICSSYVLGTLGLKLHINRKMWIEDYEVKSSVISVKVNIQVSCLGQIFKQGFLPCYFIWSQIGRNGRNSLSLWND